jgi:superfamily II DNA or RNA helicase
MATFDEFIGSLSPESHERGKQFEVFVKWFLKHDPEWSAIVENIWLWEEWPLRWGPDCGIDLIIQHTNGDHWAVQAKCYDSKYSVTKRDIDTFLSESNRKEITHRLLLTSTDIISSNAHRTASTQEKPVTFFKLADFKNSPIEYPNGMENLHKAKRKPKPLPFPHQDIAIKDSFEGFSSHDRGQLIMACGTGKTFTTLWIKEKLRSKLTLVLVPSLSLLSQTMREWTWGSSNKISVLNVCSDNSIGRDSDDINIADAPYPVTSNIEDIRSFINRQDDRVIFCTYHSSHLIAEAQSTLDAPAFDLTVCDEAHRCAGRANSMFTLILDSHAIRSNKRLFTTATPRIYSDQSRLSSEDVQFHGMDDERIFGPVFHRLSFGQAINSDLLTDYRVVVVGISDSIIRDWIDNRRLVQLDNNEVIDAASLAAEIGVLKAIEDFNLEKVITFHSRVSSAKRFASLLNGTRPESKTSLSPQRNVWADYVSGAMSSGERKIKLDNLRSKENGDVGILSNSRCLSEGIDVPALDAIAFIDPRQSQVDIIQAIGRAIRKSVNKSIGTIIIPIFVDERLKTEDFESGKFSAVWQVVNALKAHDDSLAEILNEGRRALGAFGVSSAFDVGSKIFFDIPNSLPEQFKNSLKTVVLEHTTSRWEFSYGILQAYFAKEGHTDVPTNYETEGVKLGFFCSNQRQFYKKGLLSRFRIELLEKLNFRWDQKEETWDDLYSSLTFFLRENDLQWPTQDFVTEDGLSLGAWLSWQKHSYKNNSLSEDRVSKLEKLGIDWNINDSAWDKNFNELCEYKKLHGHLFVTTNDCNSEGQSLYNWAKKQRERYNSGKLETERIDLLNSIGFPWKLLSAHERKWEEAYFCFKDYVDAYRTTIIVQKYKAPNGFALGKWVGRQRKLYEDGKLNKHQVEKLSALGFEFEKVINTWDQQLSELEDYFTQNGSSLVPSEYITASGSYLGKWCSKQRSLFRTGNLSKEQIEQLTRLDFIWDPIDYKWMTALTALKEYISTHQNSYVPNTYILEDGLDLGKWCAYQRLQYKKGGLEQHKIDHLTSLGFILEKDEDPWTIPFCTYKSYLESHPTSHVPPSDLAAENGINIANWCTTQRKFRKKGKLSSERIDKLNSIGFVWDTDEFLWNKAFTELVSFKQSLGHTNVVAAYKTESGFNLGSWLRNQKKAHKEGKLSKERLDRLQGLGVIFTN